MKHGKRDANHDQFRQEAQKCGILVADTADLGNGVPDQIWGGIHRQTFEPMLVWLEIKTAGGRLTKAEKVFHEKWTGLPVYVVREPAEALRIFGIDGN